MIQEDVKLCIEETAKSVLKIQASFTVDLNKQLNTKKLGSHNFGPFCYQAPKHISRKGGKKRNEVKRNNKVLVGLS